MTNIIGIPAGEVIVGKSDFFRDDLGLERLIVEYYFRTSETTNIAGNLFKNGGTYFGSSSGNNVAVSSASKIAFVPPRNLPNSGPIFGTASLRIEKTDYNTLAGGITSAKVTYVGILSSQLPPPKFEIIPIDDNGWIHNRFSIKATFVTYLGASGSFGEAQAVQNKFGTPVGGSVGISYIAAPTSINGVAVPAVAMPTTPAYNLPYRQWFDRFGQIANLRWQTCQTLYAYPPPNSPEGTQGEDANIQYFGFVVSSCTVNRFGLFGIASITIKEAAYLLGFNADPNGTGIFFRCASRLNL